jgi:hypothetical protein
MSLIVALTLFVLVTYLLRVVALLAPALVDRLDEWAEPLTAAVLASLVVSGTFAVNGTLVIDARLVGLGIAAAAAALRAPLLVTLVAAVAGTAVFRLVM